MRISDWSSDVYSSDLHLPLHRTQTALLIADAPQFFHDGERVTHIFDLELAHVGDPMADLASVRVRDINEPIGGMTQLLKRYVAEKIGRASCRDRVCKCG